MKNNLNKKQQQLSSLQFTLQLQIICLVYLFLAFYKISEVPYGFNADEIGTAVDSYLLANYGVDRYNMSWPVYFINYGGGQNQLYQYLAAISYKLVESNPIWIKLPGIFVGMIGLMYLQLLFSNIFNRKIGVLVGLLYTCSPYGIMHVRMAIESNLAIQIIIVANYYVYRALETCEKHQLKKRIYLAVSAILYGIQLYQYIYLAQTLAIFLVLSLIVCIKHKNLDTLDIVVFQIQLVTQILPLIIFNVVNILQSDTLVILGVTFPRLPEYRQGELLEFLDPINFLGQLIYQISQMIYKDYLNYNQTPHGIFYIVQIIIVIYYISKSYKKLKTVITVWNFKNILILLQIATFIGQFTQVANCAKVSPSYITYIMCIVLGIRMIVQKNKKLKYVIIFIYSLSFVLFFNDYYIQQSYKYNALQTASYINELSNLQDKSFKTQETKEQYILMKILNGENVGKTEYLELDDSDFQIKQVDYLGQAEAYLISKEDKSLIEQVESLIESQNDQHWYVVESENYLRYIKGDQ